MRIRRVDSPVLLNRLFQKRQRLGQDGLVKPHARAKKADCVDDRRANSDARRRGKGTGGKLNFTQIVDAHVAHLEAQRVQISAFFSGKFLAHLHDLRRALHPRTADASRASRSAQTAVGAATLRRLGTPALSQTSRRVGTLRVN